MNRIFWSLLLTIVLISGCKPEKKPEAILSEKEMVSVLMQMYLAEERFSKISVPYDSVTKLVPLFRDKVFAEAGVSHEVYMKSMEYYMANPKRLEFIYSALVDSLSLLEQSRPNDYPQYASPQ